MKWYWKFTIRACENNVIQDMIKRILNVARANAVLYSVVFMPDRKQMHTLQSSPFVYKSTRDQYVFTNKTVVINIGRCNLNIFEDIEIPNSMYLKVEVHSDAEPTKETLTINEYRRTVLQNKG